MSHSSIGEMYAALILGTSWACVVFLHVQWCLHTQQIVSRCRWPQFLLTKFPFLMLCNNLSLREKECGVDVPFRAESSAVIAHPWQVDQLWVSVLLASIAQSIFFLIRLSNALRLENKEKNFWGTLIPCSFAQSGSVKIFSSPSVFEGTVNST